MSRTRSLTWLAVVGCVSCAVPSLADMVFPDRDWEEATPGSDGVDAEKLEEAVKYLEDHSGPDGVEELVVIRNGRMIWSGPAIDRRHGVWSVTKSFTSTVLGLLIDDGKCTLDTPARQHVPALAETFPDVTLRHFTTMTSGYRAVGDEPRGSYRHGPSQTPFIPGPAPLFSPPGSQYAYWDSAMNEFAHVLTRIAGKSIEALFERRIADPIGMKRTSWDWGDFGEIDGLVVNGGSGNNGKHMQITAREMARLGHLFLNRGVWKGKQLISSSWIEAATSVHVPASLPWAHPESEIDGRGVYGFNWWANGTKSDGSRKWPGAPPGTFAASGYNNNDLFVIPEWGMVVVRLGLDERERKITDATYGTFLKKIGDAIGADRDASAVKSPIQLFNGKDLSGLYTWLKDTKYEDPTGVFTVVDGMLRVAGRPHGYIATRESYRDYRLVVEFKWGEKTYGAKYVRNSGLLLHATGPDGARRGVFMSSIECQLAQGCVGDFIVIRRKDAQGKTIPVTITSDTVIAVDGRTRWSRVGTPTVYSGKQFWWSEHDPELKELLDTAGRWDVESPLGEWTRVEIIARGNRIRVSVNGRTVNECYDVFPSAGRILLQSEGFEIWFRRFELHPLEAAGE